MRHQIDEHTARSRCKHIFPFSHRNQNEWINERWASHNNKYKLIAVNVNKTMQII